SRGKKASNFSILLRAQHREQAWNLRLMERELRRSSGHTAQRFLVGFVRTGAGSAAVHYSADGNMEHLLGDVLVDAVIGKAGERVSGSVDFNFSFVGFAEFQN